MKVVESKVKINNVMIVKGEVVTPSWKGGIQLVFTNAGIFIDNLKEVAYKGIYGHDWSLHERGEVVAFLKYDVKNKDNGLDNWINKSL